MVRDAFGFRHLDAGEGWLIFALPPAESVCIRQKALMYESGVRHQLTFMCDDIHATIHDFRLKGVNVKGEPQDEGFGITVMLGLPGGVEVTPDQLMSRNGPRRRLALRHLSWSRPGFNGRGPAPSCARTPRRQGHGRGGRVNAIF